MPITAEATHAPRWLILEELGASNFLKKSIRYGDSRMIASPRTNVKRRPYGRGGGVGRGRGEGVDLAVGVADGVPDGVGVGLPPPP